MAYVKYKREFRPNLVAAYAYKLISIKQTCIKINIFVSVGDILLYVIIYIRMSTSIEIP